MKTRVVFLDRDGTINVDHGYVFKPENVELIPGAADALAFLSVAGFKLVVVTNQSAIGRGMCSFEDVVATNMELNRKLKQENAGALLDELYIAPDAPENATDMRKPGTGMLKLLPEDWDVDYELSWMIGDKRSDLLFGKAAGIPDAQCILVETGNGKDEYGKLSAAEQSSFAIAPSLVEAAERILATT